MLASLARARDYVDAVTDSKKMFPLSLMFTLNRLSFEFTPPGSVADHRSGGGGT